MVSRRLALAVPLAAVLALLCRHAGAMNPLVVDGVYCSGNGGTFSGDCLATAIAQVNGSPSFDALLISPGSE